MSPELAKLLELITGGGSYALAAVFAYLWWSEREERRAKDVKIDAVIERCINAINAGANSLGDLRVYLGMQRTDGH